MICPNCARDMDHITRYGVTLDRCDVCGGIWLDRGELDVLFDAVRGPITQPNPEPRRPKPNPRPMRQHQPRYEAYDDDDHYYERRSKKPKKSYKKRSKASTLKYLLKEILD